MNERSMPMSLTLRVRILVTVIRSVLFHFFSISVNL